LRLYAFFNIPLLSPKRYLQYFYEDTIIKKLKKMKTRNLNHLAMAALLFAGLGLTSCGSNKTEADAGSMTDSTVVDSAAAVYPDGSTEQVVDTTKALNNDSIVAP
jgi:hypothetical protein